MAGMRFRPRFSVRTLAIFVTLICAYFGAWEATKRYAITRKIDSLGWEWTYVGNEELQVTEANSPMPFVVRSKDIRGIDISGAGNLHLLQHYHLWLFGPTIELPFEWKLHISTINEPDIRQFE